MKKKYIITIGVLVIIVSLVVFFKNVADKNLKAMDDDPKHYTNNIPGEYSNLFKQKEKIAVIRTEESNFRNPISDFYYDNKFWIEVYKVDTSIQKALSGTVLKNIFYESFKESHISYDTVYSTSDDNMPFSVQYKSGNPGKIASIHFNLSGSNRQVVVKKDNLIGYFSFLKSFSMRYNESGVIDLFVKSKEDGILIPSEILFITNQGNVYIVMIMPKDKFQVVGPQSFKEVLADND